LGFKSVLFKGKALLVMVLIVAAIDGVLAFNSFYTWTKRYTIKPLTSFETLVLPTTTGATMGYVINYTDGNGKPIEAVTSVMILPIPVFPETLAPKPCTIHPLPQPPFGFDYTWVNNATIKDIISDPPPFMPFEYRDVGVALVNSTFYKLLDLNYTGMFLAWNTTAITPKYHETLHLEKKSYVYFYVPWMQIEMLSGHFAWLTEIELIFHPGPDGQLGTPDDYLYDIVVLPLINPWQQLGSGFARTLLGRGDYGIIKTTFYWTKPVTKEVSSRFTIYIWAQEYQPTPPPPPTTAPPS